MIRWWWCVADVSPFLANDLGRRSAVIRLGRTLETTLRTISSKIRSRLATHDSTLCLIR